MTAETIAEALGGRRVGRAWMARCPAHDDREPSLSIRETKDGKVLVRCHAGCDQQRVIAVLRARGIWSNVRQHHERPVGTPSAATDGPSRGGVKRTQAALRIWKAALPGGGTLVETYLASRSIIVPVPDALLFHAAIKHPSGQQWPAMVALVTRGTDGAPLAVHRTFLARNGLGKAQVEPAKMMLGRCGGGAVRLGAIGDRLMIAEGIETALSAMQATGHVAWAALSTSGLRTLELPTEVRHVVVLADGDDAGEAAACDAGLRWTREGRRVGIARPPRGFDFNDVLRGQAFCQVEDAA
jgi:putative DNA primase/helicase